MSEHDRKEARQRVFLKGRVIFNNGSSSMDCLVRDMSGAGARISLSETSTLPSNFELYIPAKDRSYRATLRWRRADSVGITFDSERPESPAPAPVMPQAAADAASVAVLLRRITELEAENATLRKLLTTMAQPASAA